MSEQSKFTVFTQADSVKKLPDTLTMLPEGNMIEVLDLSNINQLSYLNCSEDNLKMLKLYCS